MAHTYLLRLENEPSLTIYVDGHLGLGQRILSLKHCTLPSNFILCLHLPGSTNTIQFNKQHKVCLVSHCGLVSFFFTDTFLLKQAGRQEIVPSTKWTFKRLSSTKSRPFKSQNIYLITFFFTKIFVFNVLNI